MRRFRQLVPIASSLALTLACGGGGDSSPDAGDTTPPADSGSGVGGPDAREPAEFDKLELRISPDTPLPEHEFSLYIRAADTEGGLFDEYEGTVSVESSDGELLGATDSQSVTQGTAFLKLRFDESLEGITLTVTDDDDPDFTYTSESFDVVFEGEPADPGEVVINEVNWFGPLSDFFSGVEDVWIELRNVSDREINVSQWRLEGVGVEGEDVFLFGGSVLGPGEYVTVGNIESVFGIIPGSLAGVPNTQLHQFVVPLELSNQGAQIVLQDVEGTVIDSTPDPGDVDGYPAGAADFELDFFESMERRDDITGGGYGDGTQADHWYTWNRGGDVNTTNEGTVDMGTPSEDNSDPDAAVSLPYETSFELSEPRFELLSSSGTHLNEPPDGTETRTGDRVISTDLMSVNDFDARPLRTFDCIALDNPDDELRVSVFGMESADSENDPDAGEVLVLRHKIEWYEDRLCEAPHAEGDSRSTAESLPQGEYGEIAFQTAVPAGATHVKLLIEGARRPGSDNVPWAADDYRAEQVSAETTPATR